jgi:hypothetical protein
MEAVNTGGMSVSGSGSVQADVTFEAFGIFFREKLHVSWFTGPGGVYQIYYRGIARVDIWYCKR